MDTWVGRDRCDGCDTTLLGDRTNDGEQVLCTACLLLKHSEPYCDICAIEPGYGVIDGLVYCEGCYSVRKQEIEADLAGSYDERYIL